MLDADKFLPNILADPENDGPRLVYANWLTEHGDPRGEFIHIQCQIPRCKGEAKRQKLKQREKEILKVHRNEWIAGVLAYSARNPIFRRGFVDEITISVRDFISYGDSIVEREPVTRLTLTAGAKRMKKLAECKSLGQVRHLELSKNKMGSKNLGHLLETPFLKNLTSLTARTCELGPDGARILAECPTLLNLTSLDLANNKIERGFVHLATSPHLQDLKSIDLTHNRLGNDSGEIIRDAKWQRLKRVDLSSNTVHSNGATSMALATNLSSLEYLDLSSNAIYDQGVEAIANSKAFPSLTTLSFNANTIGDIGALALAESALVLQLKDLRLSQCGLSFEGIQTMLDSPNWNSKTKLYLGINPLTNDEIGQLKKKYGKNFGIDETRRR